MRKHFSTMDVLPCADAQASRPKVRVVCEDVGRYLQHHEVAIQPAGSQVTLISMLGHWLAVWLTVACIAHYAVSHDQNFAVVAEPVSIGGILELIRRYFQRVAAFIQANEVNSAEGSLRLRSKREGYPSDASASCPGLHSPANYALRAAVERW